jgi:hypothetical protein
MLPLGDDDTLEYKVKQLRWKILYEGNRVNGKKSNGMKIIYFITLVENDKSARMSEDVSYICYVVTQRRSPYLE